MAENGDQAGIGGRSAGQALVGQRLVGIPVSGRRDCLLRVVCADLLAYERFLPARLRALLACSPTSASCLLAYERFLKEKLTRSEGVALIEASFALGQAKYTSAPPPD